MVTLVTPGMLSEVRRFFGAALDQTYTRIPLVVVLDDDDQPLLDAWGEQVTAPGIPEVGLPCKLRLVETVSRDEHGVLLVRRPLLWVEHLDQIAPGHLVTDVRDREGRLLLGSAGVISVEADPDAVGAATLVATLEGAVSTPLPPPQASPGLA